ncbi:MAG: YihY/virulence factor BrkB family protein, partial [Gemmatimonadota bacterium]|nr:YihY/virulence factor BrkB family protein [Gemmatimonadota bacterium]
TVRLQVVTSVRDYAGARAAQTVSTVLESVETPELLTPEAILTVAALLFGATAVFANIRGSLNAIWGVEPEPESKKEAVFDLIRARGRAFIMIAATGFLLALSFLVTSLAGALQSLLEEFTGMAPWLVGLVDASVSIALIALMFGAIFRTLPEVRIEWRSVWIGAFATALLFTAGKLLVARLIASATWTSYYGPGASLVAFLAWIYFSAQIFYLGAEFTQVWSRRREGAMSRARRELGNA